MFLLIWLPVIEKESASNGEKRTSEEGSHGFSGYLGVCRLQQRLLLQSECECELMIVLAVIGVGNLIVVR